MASPFKKSYHLIETPRLGNQYKLAAEGFIAKLDSPSFRFLEDSALKNALKYLLSPTDYQSKIFFRFSCSSIDYIINCFSFAEISASLEEYGQRVIGLCLFYYILT